MRIFNNKSTINECYSDSVDDSLTYHHQSSGAEHSPLYHKILTLLPKESLAKTNIRDVINGYDLVVFSKAVNIMRKEGYCFVAIGKNSFGKIVLSIIDNPRVTTEQNVITSIKDIKGTDLDLRYIHVIGSYFYPDLFKVFKNKAEIDVITRYNSLYEESVRKFNEFAIPYYVDELLKSGASSNTSSKLSKGYVSHQEDFRNDLKNKNMPVISEKSRLEYLVPDLTSLDILFDKVYKDVCMAYTIPFTKLFGESATGLNATGEGDRLNWYDQLQEFYLDVIKPFVDFYTNNSLPKVKNVVYFKKDEESLKLRAETDNLIVDGIIKLIDKGLLTNEKAKNMLIGKGIL